MILFVGLGNPTPDSQNNRHNIGFKIIDAINQNFSLRAQDIVHKIPNRVLGFLVQI